LERKRRARINRCLDELKELMVGALEVSVSKKKLGIYLSKWISCYRSGNWKIEERVKSQKNQENDWEN